MTCPKCHGAMTLKKGPRGSFYSCNGYATGRCRGTRPGPEESGKGGEPVSMGPPPPLGVPGGAFPLPAGSIAPAPFQLDVHQRAAADWRVGAAAVAAAAGSGKSTLLVERALAILSEGQHPPEALALLVFNTDAAETLRRRMEARGGRAAGRVQAFTFHAWCYALLRHWYPGDPRLSGGRILGTPGCDTHPARLIGPLLDKIDVDAEWPVALGWADRIAEALIDIDSPQALVEMKEALGIEPASALPMLKFARAWRDEKAKLGLLTFTDMLCEVAYAIKARPEAPHVAHLARMYRHVMVDEAQDSNEARWMIARWLGGKPLHTEPAARAESLFVVGDLRQAIYGFSGASPGLFDTFAHEDGVTLLTLPVNRRSTQRIVGSANEIAEGQSWNLGGACSPKPDAMQGDTVVVWDTPDPVSEAASIVEDISRRIAGGYPLLGTHGGPNYCVLARTNARLVDLEVAFVVRKIPVRVAGQPGGIWASTVGKDFLSYLRGAEGIPDWGLLDVLNKPMRRISRAALAPTIRLCRDTGGLLFEPLRQHENVGVRRFGDVLDRLNRDPWDVRCETIEKLLKKAAGSADLAGGDTDKMAAYEALRGAAQRLGSIAAIETHQKELAAEHRKGSVLLSTVHKSKGTEHPVVYVASVAKGVLPHKKAEDIDEERRLFYVAVTRAMFVCIISTGGKPSPLLVELGWARDREDAPNGGSRIAAHEFIRGLGVEDPPDDEDVPF